MLPDFNAWLLNREPLKLEDHIQVCAHAPLWPRCVGRVKRLNGNQIGVDLAGLTKPGEVTWYPRDLLERDQW